MEMAIKRKHFAHFNFYLAPCKTKKKKVRKSEQDTEKELWRKEKPKQLNGWKFDIKQLHKFRS